MATTRRRRRGRRRARTRGMKACKRRRGRAWTGGNAQRGAERPRGAGAGACAHPRAGGWYASTCAGGETARRHAPSHAETRAAARRGATRGAGAGGAPRERASERASEGVPEVSGGDGNDGALSTGRLGLRWRAWQRVLKSIALPASHPRARGSGRPSRREAAIVAPAVRRSSDGAEWSCRVTACGVAASARGLRRGVPRVAPAPPRTGI
jgi:hypothetical protein